MTLRKLFTLGIILAMFLVVPAVHAELLAWDPVETDCVTVNVYSTLETSNNFQLLGTQPDAQNKSYLPLDLAEFTKNARYLFVATCTNGTDESEYSGQARYVFYEGGGGTSGPRSPKSFGIIDCSKINNGQKWYDQCTTEGQSTAP